ncbi:unnamed protein product [Brachionus calyciflorus]|uniref:Uncharacterized protein n=1 Tax=Brachionus calyciflorus TaxID=104777 RepID=A0A813SVC8_9BILA|nr:unnamed protein product [Brachionus calyciflorus]
MESNELTLEELCSSQKFIQDYGLDQNESLNSSESLDSSVIIDSTITYCVHKIFISLIMVFTKLMKSFIILGDLICIKSNCFASVTMCDERNVILRESPMDEHIHGSLEPYEIEVEKSLGILKSTVFNSVLPIPQIYEQVRADLTKIVSPTVIAAKCPLYRTIRSQLYYIRSKSRPTLPNNTNELTLTDEFILTNDNNRFLII